MWPQFFSMEENGWMKFVFTAFIELSSPGVLEGNTIIDASLFYFSKITWKFVRGFVFTFNGLFIGLSSDGLIHKPRLQTGSFRLADSFWQHFFSKTWYTGPLLHFLTLDPLSLKHISFVFKPFPVIFLNCLLKTHLSFADYKKRSSTKGGGPHIKRKKYAHWAVGITNIDVYFFLWFTR